MMVKSRRMKEMGEKMTKRALESVKENEVLKKATKKGYTAKVDFLLRSLKLTDALDLFKDYKAVIKFIDERYTNSSSRKAYYTSLILLAKHSALDVNMDGHEAFYNRMMESAKESDKLQAQNKPKVASVKLDGRAVNRKDVLAVGQKVRDEDLGSPDSLLISMYSLTPPRRLSDYLDMKIYKTLNAFDKAGDTGNSLLINTRNKYCILRVGDFKTHKTYGKWTKKLTGVLFKVIVQSIKDHPRTYLFENTKGESYTSATFSKYFTDIFKKHLGTGLSVNDLRHLYVTMVLAKNPSMHERQEVALQMGHSIDLQNFYNIATSPAEHAAKEAKEHNKAATVKGSKQKILDLLKGVKTLEDLEPAKKQISKILDEVFNLVMPLKARTAFFCTIWILLSGSFILCFLKYSQ